MSNTNTLAFFAAVTITWKYLQHLTARKNVNYYAGVFFFPGVDFIKLFGVNYVTISCKMDHFINVDSVVILL